jgi:hypothetical protein
MGFFQDHRERDPEGARLRRAIDAFKTHYAWEGLTVSEFVRRHLKQLRRIWRSSAPQALF